VTLTIELGDNHDVRWAQQMVIEHHYLHQPVDPRARPMVYVVRRNDVRLGLVMLGIPHATKCAGWWGYPGLPTQWQVVDLCRIWLHPDVQANGQFCEPSIVPGFHDRRGQWRPAVASWAIAQVLGRVQADRVRLWPPVLLSEPYQILLAISYHDPQYHRGTIYKAGGAEPMYMDRNRQPVPGPSGKYGWAWRLPSPAWAWYDLNGIKPRTLRLLG
jgi:hypothetical protein